MSIAHSLLSVLSSTTRLRLRSLKGSVLRLAAQVQGREARIQPFDEVFPDAVKMTIAPTETIETPELAGADLIDNVSYLRTPAFNFAQSYTTPEDFVSVLHDVLYCTTNNVIFTRDRRVPAECTITPLWPEPMRQDPVGRIDGVTTLFQQLHPTYYHPLIDNLPRLITLSRPPYTETGDVQLLASKKLNPVEAYLLDRFKPDNFHVLPLDSGQVYELDTVLFTPFKTRPDAAYWPQLYRDTFADTIWPRRPSRRYGRYFISRNHDTVHRHIENLNDCVALAKRYGFEVIIPSELTPEEEVELFYDAEILLGAHGAGFANAVFSPPGLTIIDLFPAAKLDPTFYFLAKAFGHRFLYWNGTESWMKAPSFVVDVSALRSLLDSATARVMA
jgi:hypothetical protein